MPQDNSLTYIDYPILARAFSVLSVCIANPNEYVNVIDAQYLEPAARQALLKAIVIIGSQFYCMITVQYRSEGVFVFNVVDDVGTLAWHLRQPRYS